MEGGKLTTWEKVYWGAFVAGMSLLAYNNLPRFWKTEEPPTVDEDKEARKLERTRLILAGQSVLDGEEFDGLEPEASPSFLCGVQLVDENIESQVLLSRLPGRGAQASMLLLTGSSPPAFETRQHLILFATLHPHRPFRSM